MSVIVNRMDVIDTLTRAKQNIKTIQHPIGDVLKEWQETVIDALIEDVKDIPSPKLSVGKCCANCKYVYTDYCGLHKDLFHKEPQDVYEWVCSAWTSEDE